MPKAACEACDGKRYLVCIRSADNRKAVERCDLCSWHGYRSKQTLWDDDAAKLAQADGIKCEPSYPCYVIA